MELWLVKLGRDGSLVWQRSFGGTGAGLDAVALVEIPGGGYYVAGMTRFYGAQDYDLFVLRLDRTGLLEAAPESWVRNGTGVVREGGPVPAKAPVLTVRDEELPATEIAGVVSRAWAPQPVSLCCPQGTAEHGRGR